MQEQRSCNRPVVAAYLLVPCRRLSSASQLPLAACCSALAVPAAATKVRASCPGTPHGLSYDPARGCLSTSTGTAFERVQNTLADGAVASRRSCKLCSPTCVQDWTAYVCQPRYCCCRGAIRLSTFARGRHSRGADHCFTLHILHSSRLAQCMNAHGFRHTHTTVIQH